MYLIDLTKSNTFDQRILKLYKIKEDWTKGYLFPWLWPWDSRNLWYYDCKSQVSVAVPGSPIFLSDTITSSHQRKENQNHKVHFRSLVLLLVKVGFLLCLEQKHFQGPTRENEVSWQDICQIEGVFLLLSQCPISVHPVRTRDGVNVQRPCVLLKLSPLQLSASLAGAPYCEAVCTHAPTWSLGVDSTWLSDSWC